MKRLFAMVLALLCILTGCSKQPHTPEELYDVCEELMQLLWDADYTAFTEKKMTEFAKLHYEQEYLAYYLEDPAYNAGVYHVQDTELISSLLLSENRGFEYQTLDGVDYVIQKLKVRVYIEQFRPDYPEQNYFEEGQTYDLIYQVYFIDQDGDYKISGFSYLPEDGDMLPIEHRQKLTQQQKDDMLRIANQYLYWRYEMQCNTFSAQEAWDFYTTYVAGEFLDRDGISLESLNDQQQEYEKYGVNVRLLKKQLQAGDGKTMVYDGYTADYHYWVEAVYTYRIHAADAAFLTERGLAETQELHEMLYFEWDDQGVLHMVFAEYLQD